MGLVRRGSMRSPHLRRVLTRFQASCRVALAAIGPLAVDALALESLHVPRDYPDIQAAIDAATDGDQVLVEDGVYGPVDFLGKAITVQAVSIGGASIESSTTTAVRFVSGEGSDSRLIGFGIRGRVGDTPSGGIYCEVGPRAATPYIADCVIGNCDASDALAEGIGVHGNPTLERCTISGNRGEIITFIGTSAGGGVFGAPTMRACRITGNSAMTGGGLVLFDGARLEDCAIVGNQALVGASQYGPIYSYGGGLECRGNDVVLVGCLIAENEMWGYTDFEGFQYGYGAAIAGGPTLIGCTIVDNRLYDGEVGGIFGGGVLTGCILRDNDGEQGGSSFRYCNAPGPPQGEGNFDADPRFDRARGNYALLADSPCIDAGSPTAVDPDGTRADVGSRWFNQRPPQADVRVGAGTNRLALVSDSLPVLGEVWSATLRDPGPPQPWRIVALQGNRAPGSISYPFGEVLLDLGSPLVFSRFQLFVRRQATFSFPIPKRLELLGIGVSLQGGTVGGVIALSNALDVVIGVPGDSLP